jgi:hypothetical protein
MGCDNTGNPDRNWCATQANRLAQVDYAQRFLDLMTAAQRANVAFYPIDVAGLRADMPDISKGGATAAAMEAMHVKNTQRVDQLMTLANNTDGKAIVATNDLLGGLRRVTDDLSAYYLLGYQSTNPAADGRWRRIDVKVKQPNVDVSARRGYLAFTAEMVKAEADARNKPARVRTGADEALDRLGRIRADARAFLTTARTASGLDVVVELASREIEAGRFSSGAPLTVTATPKEAGAPASVEGRIPAGARSVVVTVPLANGATAAWRISLLMPGASATDEPIEEGVDVAASSGDGTSDLRVFRAAASPRAVPQRSADPVFRRTERVHLEWPVDAAGDSRSARLLNRQGEALPVPVAVSERAEGDRTVLTADLQLAPLAPGDYVIELSTTRGEKTRQQWLAIRVIR